MLHAGIDGSDEDPLGVALAPQDAAVIEAAISIAGIHVPQHRFAMA
jgi:hypothetical protein